MVEAASVLEEVKGLSRANAEFSVPKIIAYLSAHAGQFVSEEAEKMVVRSVLGSYDMAIETFDQVRNSEVFSKQFNKAMFDAAKATYAKSETLSMHGLSEAMREMGYEVNLAEEVGKYFADQEGSGVIPQQLTQEAIDELLQKWQTRRLFGICADLLLRAESEEDFSQVQEVLLEKLTVLEDDRSGPMTLDELGAKYEEELRASFAIEDGGKVYSGISSLDEALDGFRGGQLVVVAARPGIGKTALLTSMALNQARKGLKVGVLSLEMKGVELLSRVIANNSSLDVVEITRIGESHPQIEQLYQGMRDARSLPIVISDNPSVRVDELYTKINKIKLKHGLDILYIDYLQLIQPSSRGMNEYETVSEASKALKGIAKKLDIPIVTLAQLNRQVEMREDKKPKMSDLRSSGQIEQDADVILLLHRPEHYNITHDLQGQELHGASTRGLAWIIVAKQRAGAAAGKEIKVRYEGCYTRFSEEEEHGQYHPYSYNPNGTVQY